MAKAKNLTSAPDKRMPFWPSFEWPTRKILDFAVLDLLSRAPNTCITGTISYL